MHPLLLNPLELDRAIAELARRRRRFLAALESSDAEDHAFELLPSGLDRSLLAELRGAPDDPFLRAAEAWLGVLLVAHGSISQTRAVAAALYRSQHGLNEPEPGLFTLAELRQRALGDAARRDAWFAAFTANAANATDARFELWERRAELRDALRVPTATDGARTATLARGVLSATDDAYRELGIHSWGALIEAGLGRMVPGEWPTRLDSRRAAELLDAEWLEGVEPEPFATPPILGAASVLRALYALGGALADAAAPRNQPFVVAREPAGLRPSTTGALFALFPAHAAFAERRLGVTRSRAREYRQRIARVLLVGARQSALRALLRTEGGSSESRASKARREAFVELGVRALGFEPNPDLAGVVFAGDRGATELEALLLAARCDQAFTERHDEDWFRNPRAIRELRGELETVPERSARADELDAGLAALTRLFAEAL